MQPVDELVDAHSARLYRLACIYLHDPESARDVVQEALSLTDALMRLPLVYRDVLVWRYYLQLSDAEIATQLGIAHGALRTRLSRARKAMAALLKEEEA